jgi:hypothetical protein
VNIETLNFFQTTWGLLVFNDRFEIVGFHGIEVHRELALQEWFAYLKRRLAVPEETGPRICPGCGSTEC